MLQIIGTLTTWPPGHPTSLTFYSIFYSWPLAASNIKYFLLVFWSPVPLKPATSYFKSLKTTAVMGYPMYF